LGEGRGREERLAEGSEAGSRGDDRKETHDGVVSTAGGSIDRSIRKEDRMRMESKISKLEGKVGIDLGFARGEEIEEVRGNQAFTGKREAALKPQKPQYYILGMINVPILIVHTLMRRSRILTLCASLLKISSI
jgi:hypothetical protein